MTNLKYIFLILMLSFLTTLSTNADDTVNQDPLPHSFWIGIDNLEVFYEFKYLNANLQKANEGRVAQVKEGSTTRWTSWTDTIRQKASEKENNRGALRTKYRNALPLYQYSIIELSDDGKYIAYTSEYKDRSFSIMHLYDKQLLRINAEGDKIVSDILWLAGSRAVAIITRSEKIGRSPLEILWAFAGHPVPHNNFYLEIYSTDGRRIKNMTIMEDIEYGQGMLVK